MTRLIDMPAERARAAAEAAIATERNRELFRAAVELGQRAEKGEGR